MWFRNLLVYRLNLESPLQAEELETALASLPAKACGSQVASTYGFVAPWGKNEDAPLVHASQGFMLIAARQEERILPASVVRDAVQEKVDELEAAEARKVYKKEKDQIKDEIVQTLMPRAFIRKSVTRAAIDAQNGFIYVDASSSKKAEELLSAMREALGSLPVRPVSVKQAPTATFTGWVKSHEASHGLFLLDECELRDSAEDGGIIRIKREDLSSEEVQNHLAAGKLATVLSLAWEEKLSFLLDDKLVIKRLRFEDLLQSQAEQDGGDDAASQFDASFVLMMLTLRDFIPQLLEALGGEEIPLAV
ncbi:recombination-associated protein RdgC [Thiopseudomonas denitrificans]|uniref:Recombination-associated protein RdgC n=1 Tax=Thiopseudomonas denitrificans TaxID=1501432 RepID=A0A4R6TZD6_9GAMM|nr:recombination-associated protein RdgC [Thiopseudomonas denitrificans]TDQ39358.1 recombination associated protein RdgC [Thiopseudomonas denitrificans]